MGEDGILAALTDISGRLGNVEGQNNLIIAEQARASQGRSEIYRLHQENQAAIAILTHSVGQLITDGKTAKTDISDLKDFRIKLAVAALMVSGVVTGAVNLIYLAVSHFGEIKTVIRDFMK